MLAQSRGGRTDLAAGYYRNGQLAVALEEVKRATAIDTNYAAAYGLLGLIYMDIGEQSDAEENFQRALKLDAIELRDQQQLRIFPVQYRARTRSIEYFNHAIRDALYQAPARANQNAGSCLMRIKDYAAAEPYLRRAFELDAGHGSTEVPFGSAVSRDQSGRQGHFLLQHSCEVGRAVGRKSLAGIACCPSQRRFANRNPVGQRIEATLSAVNRNCSAGAR